MDRVTEAFQALATATGGLGFAAALAAAALLLGLLVLVLVGRIVRSLFRYHGYTLWDEGGSYRSQAGLLSRREVAVGIRKVQTLRAYQRLLYRYFGRYRIQAPTIGGSLDAEDDEGMARGALDADTLEIPWAARALVEKIRSGMLRGEGEGLALLPDDEAFTRVSRLYIRAAAMRFFCMGLPSGILALFLLSNFVSDSWRGPDVDGTAVFVRYLEIWGYAAVIWGVFCLVAAAPIGWLSWRARAYMHNDNGLSCRSGLIGYSVEAFLFRKAQGVTVKQSPLQRRHGLATLKAETACGSVTVPYIEYAKVCALRDHIVHKVETSRLGWY